MMAMSVLDETARRQEIINIVQTVLRDNGVHVTLNAMDFHVLEKAIIESTSKPAGLSVAVLDFMFPRERAPSTVYHYTGPDGFLGIVSSGELRLYPIRNRLGQGGELEAFAQAHSLDGYLTPSNGEELYKSLSDDLFYASLTRVPPKDPDIMWGAFAKGTGVRFEFVVNPKPAAELRPVHYEQNKSPTLLKEINNALKKAGEPPFNPWTISRIGAFYLNSTVEVEDEVRLLVKRYRDGIDLTQNDGKSDYWPVPIDQPNDFCDLQLTGIRVSPSGDRNHVDAVLAGTRFSKVPVTGP